jgi:hypothetical protein
MPDRYNSGVYGLKGTDEAIKTPGNMGLVHTPLCKEILEILEILGVSQKTRVSRATGLLKVMPKYVFK